MNSFDIDGVIYINKDIFMLKLQYESKKNSSHGLFFCIDFKLGNIQSSQQ